MSREALPCFLCGKTLLNVCAEAENQPREGVEFRTLGQYGSTFWDSMDGEELVLNICDECLRGHADRLAQHKRYRPVTTTGGLLVGRHWVDRPMVGYTGVADDGALKVEPEEIGTALPNTEWLGNASELRECAEKLERLARAGD